jgi:2-deoxy-D-gluconate 3-dehydrogenase
MNLSQFSLEGKVALVTGAGTGIGQAIAFGLARAGADIAVAYREHIDETFQHISSIGRSCQILKCDFGNASVQELHGMIHDVCRTMTRLDVLVNNAGILRKRALTEIDEEDWDEVQRINLRSAFFLSQAAAKVMIENDRGGKIINILSLLAFRGGDSVGSYTASKSGFAGITKAMANEWAKHNINVNAIAPGYILTELTRSLWGDSSQKENICAQIPAGRWGEPSDIVGAAVFLASEASKYIHGAIIPVDGGWLVR